MYILLINPCLWGALHAKFHMHDVYSVKCSIVIILVYGRNTNWKLRYGRLLLCLTYQSFWTNMSTAVSNPYVHTMSW